MAKFASDVLFSIDTGLQLKKGVNTKTITTSKVLTYQDSTVQILTNSTAGVLNCTLPAEKSGVGFWIRNQLSSASNISVNNPAASGVVLLTPGDCDYFVCDGSTWTAIIKGT